MALIFSAAVPLPPEMIAPACPMRRPGGAVCPAIKPTTGFFTFCLMYSAAVSSALPPISPVASAAPNDVATTNDASTPKTAAPVVTTTAAEPPAAGKPKARSAQAKSLKLADANAETTDATPASADNAGSFAVQLAAPASEAAARESMAKLQRQFGGELAGHQLKYHRASVANKSVYRVRVVGLSYEGATALCQKLQGKGGACFVIKD